MPNGGVPLHMILQPANGDHVVYCQAAEIKVFTTEEWAKAKSAGEPILVLNRAEALVVERFLRYWLQDDGDGPVYRQPGVSVEYDY